jgi:hypothetical protein
MKTEERVKQELTSRLAAEYLKGKISRDQLVDVIGYLSSSLRVTR